jgi:hypothetical protein
MSIASLLDPPDIRQTTAARVRALWAEMKIIRTLKHEPHPSIIKFEAFVITPSYALYALRGQELG